MDSRVMSAICMGGQEARRQRSIAVQRRASRPRCTTRRSATPSWLVPMVKEIGWLVSEDEVDGPLVLVTGVKNVLWLGAGH